MPKRDPELTAQIVRKASVGENKKRIAEDLGITQKTVMKHLQAVKFKVDSRTENGEDPFAAWGDVILSILFAAGLIGATLASLKVFEELRRLEEQEQKK